jgi:hypothetical protein
LQVAVEEQMLQELQLLELLVVEVVVLTTSLVLVVRASLVEQEAHL